MTTALNPGDGQPSHPEGHRPRVAAFEIAVTRHGPYREEFRVAVVAQIEHAGKTRRGITRLVPESIAALGRGEILDAACDRRMIDVAGGHEPKQRPSRLRRR